MKIDLDDLISQKEAAQVRGCSSQTISSLVKRGKLKTFTIGGKTFVSRKEVKAYKPSKGGRPKKAPAKKASKRITRPRRSN
jgi:excisionase family DNA binding protein